MAKRGIKFPWGEVAAYIGEHVSGNALLQHMSKETKKRCKEGRPIPEDREQFLKGPGHYQMISAAGFGDRRTRTISDIQARRNSRVEDDDDDDFTGEADDSLATPSRSASKRKNKPIIKNEPADSDDDDFVPEESPNKKRRVVVPMNPVNHNPNAQLIIKPKVPDTLKNITATTSTHEYPEVVQDIGTKMQADSVLKELLFGNGGELGGQKVYLRNDRFLTIIFNERAAQINFQRMILNQEREAIRATQRHEQESVAYQQLEAAARSTALPQYNRTPDYVMNAIYPPSSTQRATMSRTSSFMPSQEPQLASSGSFMPSQETSLASSSFDQNVQDSSFSLPYSMMPMNNSFHAAYDNSVQHGDTGANNGYVNPVAVVENMYPDMQLESSQDEEQPLHPNLSDQFHWMMDSDEEMK